MPFIPPPRWLSTTSFDFNTRSKAVNKITLNTDVDINLPQEGYLGEDDTETPTSAYTMGCVC